LEDNAIIVNNVTKTFQYQSLNAIGRIKSKLTRNKNSNKSFNALDGISFTVKKGEAISVIGLNGSGKTTLLRVIAGLISPSSGSVQVNGKLSPILATGIGFQKELSARENVILNGMLLGFSKSDMEKKVKGIIEWAELKRFSKMKIGHFSSGMRNRLAFGITLHLNPDILILDEVLSVGDKNFREKSYNAFLTFRKNKKTILHATHNLSHIKEQSDRILLIHRGKMIMIGEPEEVLQKFEIIRKKD